MCARISTPEESPEEIRDCTCVGLFVLLFVEFVDVEKENYVALVVSK